MAEPIVEDADGVRKVDQNVTARAGDGASAAEVLIGGQAQLGRLVHDGLHGGVVQLLEDGLCDGYVRYPLRKLEPAVARLVYHLPHGNDGFASGSTVGDVVGGAAGRS